jgi:hypothetical protein
LIAAKKSLLGSIEVRCMKRRTFITTLALGSAELSVRALGKTSGATFVVAHGAWSAGWAWKRIARAT